MMKVLHLLCGGSIGGIEHLCLEFSKNVEDEWFYCFVFSGGPIYEQMKATKPDNVFCLYSKRFSFRSKKRLLSLCQKLKIDVVIIHHITLYLNDFYIYLARHLKNVLFVRYLHEAVDEKATFSARIPFFNRFAKCAMLKSISVSDQVVCVSRFVLASWKGYYQKEKRFHSERAAKWSVVYNGVPNDFIADGESNCIIGKKIILYVGRIEKIKGLKEFFQAASLCDLSDFKIVIVGTGKDLVSQKRFCEKNGLSVDFVGATGDVKRYLTSGSIFVYPSVCQEAFGISLVEAMAYGLVCVASNRGGLPEVIQDGQDGYLVNPEDSAFFSRVLSNVLGLFHSSKGQDSLLAISSSAKEKAKNFTLNKTIQSLNDCVLKNK